LTRQNAKKIIGVLDNDQYFVKNSLHSIISKGLRYDLRYVLGILNSRLMDFYFKNKIGSTGEIFSQMKIAYIEGLPIKIIDLSIGDEVKSHNALVFLVDNIHELYKKHFSAKDPRTRELMQRQIAATDRQIDQLVYQLYGLTEEEIRIVEGNL
jgi:hypothetical protein